MSLKIMLAGAAAGTALFAAHANAAETASVEKDFEQICLPMTSSASAADNARAAGYVAAPAEVRKRMRGFPKDGEILWRTEEGRMTIFMGARQKKRPGGPFPKPMIAELCGVATVPKQPDLAGKVREMLNVGPPQTVGQASAFVYEQTEAGRVRLDARSAYFTVKADKGIVRMATTKESRDMSMAILILPHPDVK